MCVVFVTWRLGLGAGSNRIGWCMPRQIKTGLRMVPAHPCQSCTIDHDDNGRFCQHGRVVIVVDLAQGTSDQHVDGWCMLHLVSGVLSWCTEDTTQRDCRWQMCRNGVREQVSHIGMSRVFERSFQTHPHSLSEGLHSGGDDQISFGWADDVDQSSRASQGSCAFVELSRLAVSLSVGC